eukprot:CAMPEP_0170577312 /NCGR_PEP_ID=MMETSP0224-20130122/4860_1 /TAXON_ID=285029 /ORGANISM="Togula jolla, Strain CCCM 725" /LENGTH=99 /DNA_ID=CAMNT_0010900215 /DNA_START=572 /DNA_END=869 /DNA_ORIENTATION=-
MVFGHAALPAQTWLLVKDIVEGGEEHPVGILSAEVIWTEVVDTALETPNTGDSSPFSTDSIQAVAGVSSNAMASVLGGEGLAGRGEKSASLATTTVGVS